MTTLTKLANLCKRRGFLFQSYEIYGGARGLYDYGPYGVEVKRNLANAWWTDMVTKRQDTVGLDSPILSPMRLWEASGHLSQFTDQLVDCRLSRERFRADKAPKLLLSKSRDHPLRDVVVISAPDKAAARVWQETIERSLAPGATVERRGNDVILMVKGVLQDRLLLEPRDGSSVIAIPYYGYASPGSNSPFLTDPRAFNLMFRSSLGPVDPVESLVAVMAGNRQATEEELRKAVQAELDRTAVFLRPETAQNTYVQFLNYVQATGLRPPFGIAQVGKSFRNEITLEHMIFRTPEFEQMELQFFCPPEDDERWHSYWTAERLAWWQRLANTPAKFVLKHHKQGDLAHYAKACTDIEFEYPWGFGELEGIANRTDYDLRRHAEFSNTRFDVERGPGEAADGETPTKTGGGRYVPYVIEPAAGLSRGVLALFVDAYHEETKVGANGAETTRTVMRLHPRLAPIKAGIFPLVKQPELVALGKRITEDFAVEGLKAKYEDANTIGKRYTRHDEIGTPYCLTIDHESLKDGFVTVRDRNTTTQERMSPAKALEFVKSQVK